MYYPEKNYNVTNNNTLSLNISQYISSRNRIKYRTVLGMPVMNLTWPTSVFACITYQPQVCNKYRITKWDKRLFR